MLCQYPGDDVKLTWFPAWLCVSRARNVVHEVLNLRIQGSIPANRAYNVLYLYKMNRLGQVLGEGCTWMWETILPRAIATFCRWGNIVLFTFYLKNNSRGPSNASAMLPLIDLSWPYEHFGRSSEDVLRTKASGDVCAPGHIQKNGQPF